ncbi:hypothetical protein [Mycobacterium vicinigordonae]|uniref:DUF3604 domain-containing protein n=1 Tax=Mycobacterium vicinigordonae TaxID=1719132 RepID=A0A7D6IM85_9MYCO|nr:hypothetical protein [Mycobacterium vicinigordonae]QLL07600.1 hypothetical protein H0P51_00790 [Mycobacterium vicinigordonae]
MSDRAATAEVALRPQPRLAANDCAVTAVRDAITAEFQTLPFLGELRCSHDRVTAGSLAEVVFTYTVGSSGIADSGWLKLCFRYYSDWDLQTSAPDARDYASARLIKRSLIGGASEDGVATVQQLLTRYDVKGGERPFQKSLLIHLVDGYLRPGDVIEIRLGDRRFGGAGTRVQTFVEDEFEVHLFVDPLGTSRMAHAAVSRIAIVPGEPHQVVVHGPRLVRDDAVSVGLRAHLQDRWGNTCTEIAATLHAYRDGAPVASAGTPETGWASARLEVPATPGRVDVIAQTRTAVLGPGTTIIDVLHHFPSPRAIFCDLHVHSNDTVGTQSTDWNLRYARDIGALDVLGYTANDFQITDEAWLDVVAACRGAAQDGAFVCFPGVEWCGTAGAGGDHNVIFLGEDTTLARSLEWRQGMSSNSPTPQTWPVTQLYAAYEKDPESYLLIPHVGGRRAVLDWHHRDLERLIEVHSTWGSSPWFLQDALAKGLRLGASASSDEHRGRPGGGAPGANIFGGFGGLTGVLAPALTATEVGRGLRARRTWATTGVRSVALLRSGDHWMGDEFSCETSELDACYALYGTTGWEEVAVYDSGGQVWRRDLHAETGLSDDLVRIRWGGARHRDRYRWATWTGRVSIAGSAAHDITPWAATHPEQYFDIAANEVRWRTTTYGAGIGILVRLADLSRARIELETTVQEDNLTTHVALRGADLVADGSRDVSVGGLNLKIRVERIAEPTALPETVVGNLNLQLPSGDSAAYLRAMQFDGHQVWTSPLFVTRPKGPGR